MDHLSMIRRMLFAWSLILFLFVAQSALAKDEFGGIGAQVVPISTGELSVLHVIDGSPAETGGLLPGDVIIDVGGLAMQGSDFDLVTKKYLWGRIGTSVSLVWLRPGVAGKMKAEIKRVAITKDMKVKSTPGVNISTPK